jgi:hypothetical protein
MWCAIAYLVTQTALAIALWRQWIRACDAYDRGFEDGVMGERATIRQNRTVHRDESIDCEVDE